MDPGFEPEGVLTLGFDLPRNAYSEPARQRFFFEELSRRPRPPSPGWPAAVANGIPLTAASP